MIKTILISGALLASFSLTAQKTSGKAANGVPKGKIETKKQKSDDAPSAADRATRLTAKMTKQLDLTTEQAGFISDINLGIAAKNEAVRNDQSLSAEQKKQLIEANNSARIEMCKAHLTPAQIEKFDQLLKEHAAKVDQKKAENKSTEGEL
jgi:superfamily II DNA helicase RecQ